MPATNRITLSRTLKDRSGTTEQGTWWHYGPLLFFIIIVIGGVVIGLAVVVDCLFHFTDQHSINKGFLHVRRMV